MSERPEWRFRRMQPGEMNIDPIESEFFSTEALGSLADALVRESIQNSLDAKVPGSQARVRIAFPSGAAIVPKAKAARYLAGLWPHLAAEFAGLLRSGIARLGKGDATLFSLAGAIRANDRRVCNEGLARGDGLAPRDG